MNFRTIYRDTIFNCHRAWWFKLFIASLSHIPWIVKKLLSPLENVLVVTGIKAPETLKKRDEISGARAVTQGSCNHLQSFARARDGYSHYPPGQHHCFRYSLHLYEIDFSAVEQLVFSLLPASFQRVLLLLLFLYYRWFLRIKYKWCFNLEILYCFSLCFETLCHNSPATKPFSGLSFGHFYCCSNCSLLCFANCSFLKDRLCFKCLYHFFFLFDGDKER